MPGTAVANNLSGHYFGQEEEEPASLLEKTSVPKNCRCEEYFGSLAWSHPFSLKAKAASWCEGTHKGCFLAHERKGKCLALVLFLVAFKSC